ncbi:hypothetical protein [Neisseria lactamica]|uniref:hypothetical protein n=1 Tax=Neisseria lactamica TaxID=486 RepID=UPI0012901BAB|nr:hypothetical protein [Neisseria lactamica]
MREKLMKQVILVLAAAFALTACGGETDDGKPVQVASSATDAGSYTNSAQAVLDKYKQDYQVSLSDKGVVIFEQPAQLFDALGDYSSENNGFEQLEKDPFSVRLSYRTNNESDSEILKNETEMTLLYGILKTFAHTNVGTVSVKSVSLDGNGKFLDKYALTLKTDRTKTLKALQDLGLAKGFDELVETKPNDKFRFVGLSGSDIYDNIIYKDDNRKQLIDTLKSVQK